MTSTSAVQAGVSRLAGGAAIVAAAAATGAAVAEPAGLRLAVAGAAGLVLVVAALRLPTSTVLGVLITWLVSLGLVRRLTSGVSPKEAWGDPLLLVGAAVWVALALLAVRSGALRRRTPLTNAVLILGGLLALSALNPLQGGLTVGLSGALLVVVPMVAFLVGRALVDDRMLGRLMWLAARLGVAVAVYGLAQTFSRFPSWDLAWIDNGGYAALNVGGFIRPFASFSAASEYTGFLGVAMVAWMSRARGALGWPASAGALALLGTALWYASSRGIVVLTIAAIGLMLSARAGLSLGRAVLLGLAVLAALPALVGWLAPQRFGDDVGGQLVQHQVEGLTDPLGEGSTLPVHIGLIGSGIESAFRQPIGTGVGSITISGGKYGGAVGGAEGDPGRAPFAAGLPGLIAYVAVVVCGFPRAYRLAVRRCDAASLAALGLVAVTFLQWLNGGHYAVAFWAWLALGWVDRAERSVASSAAGVSSPMPSRG